MPKLVDLIGKRFYNLSVICREQNSKNGDSRWLCLCDCGQKRIVLGINLKSGQTKSCGCTKIMHGCSKRGQVTREFLAWNNMMQRCKNKKHPRYNDWGGRGITVCERWDKFENFLEDMEVIPEKYELDRIDNNKEYSKENCRLVLEKLQSRNRRSNVNITFNNKIQCLKDWANEYNISYSTLRYRLNVLKWTIEKSLITPLGKQNKKKEK